MVEGGRLDCSDGLRRRAADFDYRCRSSELAVPSSPQSITVNLDGSRPIDGVIVRTDKQAIRPTQIGEASRISTLS